MTRSLSQNREPTAEKPFWPNFPIKFVKYTQYLPHLIEKLDSKWLSLATTAREWRKCWFCRSKNQPISILGQAPRHALWLILLLLIVPFASAQTTAEQDRQKLRDFFSKQYPDIALDAYKDGAYIFDQKAKEQWLEIEDFPPYEFDIEDGQLLFETAFANGKSYGDCLQNEGIAIKQTYPKWDEAEKTIITLEYDINRCREQNGETALKYGTGDLAKISAYMAYTSRGKIIDLPEPQGDAIMSYEAGKKYYYSKRGQLNMACANCHLSFADVKLRYETPGPVLGQVSHWPVYRSKWQHIGTLHERIRGCSKQVRANPLPHQDEVYRNVEYFLSYMSKGLESNGPANRK